MTSWRHSWWLAIVGLTAGGLSVKAQTPVPATVTLAQAQELALRQHPRIGAAALTAQAGQAVVRQVRSAYLPTAMSLTTGVGAENSSTMSAGAVQTSSLYSRASSGVAVSQLITDFGRTSSLASSARLRTAAAGEALESTRAQVLFEVQTSYYQALASQAVLRVARETQELRQLTLRQVTALAQNGLRSTLDVSFAQVNLSEAELALSRAENLARADHARLSSALGNAQDQPFMLMDEGLPPALPDTPEPLIDQALQNRPDLAALRLDHEALDRFAQAEGRLQNPTISAGAVAGVAPYRDERLRETYSAAGVNLAIPIFTGGLYGARHAEAQLRAAAAGKDVEDEARRIARDVQVAWLDANDAFRRLDVTARLLTEADEALRLAQARYDAGLGGIVELNQAQVNQTSAQITAASAKYDYLIRTATLNYATGSLH